MNWQSFGSRDRNRQAVASAADDIDRELRLHAGDLVAGLPGEPYFLNAAMLRAYFRISEMDRLVEVTKVVRIRQLSGDLPVLARFLQQPPDDFAAIHPFRLCGKGGDDAVIEHWGGHLDHVFQPHHVAPG